MRWSIRCIRKPQVRIAQRDQLRTPEAWCVATSGLVAIAIAVTHGVGVSGSCRWRTSKRSVSSASLMRK